MTLRAEALNALMEGVVRTTDDVVEYLGATRKSAYEVLRSLEVRGLVERRSDATDAWYPTDTAILQAQHAHEEVVDLRRRVVLLERHVNALRAALAGAVEALTLPPRGTP